MENKTEKTDNFTFQKKEQLSKTDKSNIGTWDKKIQVLCEKINKKDNYYTTSSCSGRIVLLKYSEDKTEGAFLFRTHELINFKEFKEAILKAIKGYNGLIEYQQTSCILHVACKTIYDSLDIVKKAKESGWKRSGVMSGGKRYVVELHSTEQSSFPIADNGKLLVDDGYLRLIVKISNNKLKRVWKKINRLKDVL
jgi:tRNA wybutosine-synthesizing protein 3